MFEGAEGGCQLRFLKRQLSLPVSTISQWWVTRSSSAVVILGSPNTVGHSPKARFVVMMTLVDRKSGVEGKSVSVRVDLGGRRIIKKKKRIVSRDYTKMISKHKN